MMGVGNRLFEKDHDFICEGDTELIAINNGGAAFLLVYTLFLLSFSVMIWFVFYKIPDLYGLIPKRAVKLDLKNNQQHPSDDIAASLISLSKEDE
jgi:hypothetical protein